jgi:hypothetical protein
MTTFRLHLFVVVTILCALGLSFTAYQILVLKIPYSLDETDRVWTIDANIVYESRNKQPAKVTLHIPRFEDGFNVINERFISNNYGQMLHNNEQARKVVWSIRRPERKQSLYYRAVVHRSFNQPPLKERGETYSNKNPFPNPLEKLAAQSLIEPIRSQSADIETFVSETIKRLNQPDNNNALLLLDGNRSPLNKAAVAAQLLTLAHIRVDIVHALPLYEGNDIQTTAWMRCFNGTDWLYFNPDTGREGLPDNMLPWWKGTKPVFHVKGGKNAHIKFSVSSQEINALQIAQTEEALQNSFYSKISLYNLPVQTQHVYQILLMVPIGVLVILLLRTFVGIATFGTFTPVLIALAFRETQLLWGIILFVVVSTIGLLIRSYLEHLRLLLLPRLSVVLTFVVIIMVFISLLGHHLGIERGLSVALFPMVILTMTIERMAIIWEERGATETIKTSLGSLLAASLSYWLMTNETLTYLIFTFPGLLLIFVALMVTVGRYSGYRLSELRRFHAFLKDSK